MPVFMMRRIKYTCIQYTGRLLKDISDSMQTIQKYSRPCVSKLKELMAFSCLTHVELGTKFQEVEAFILLFLLLL